MQFHHHGYEMHDPRIQRAAGEGVDRPVDIPEEMDVLVVGTGPAGVLLAAQLSQYPGVRTRVIEKRGGRLQVGQADGLQPRSIETFQAFGFAQRLLQEAYRITEMSYWRPDPADRHGIRRDGRSIDDTTGLSEFPHVICNQARVQDYFTEAAAFGPGRVSPDHGWELTGLEVVGEGERPVTAHLRRTVGKDAGAERTVRTRFLVGCDGAHSLVRTEIGGHLHGERTNHAWGVMDVLVDTDFPDIRTKCVIQSADGGNILLIPREGNCLVRLYVDLGTVTEENAGSLRATSVEDFVRIVQGILAPYRFAVRHVAWSSVYEVGQRLTDTFDDVSPAPRGTRSPHVFIAGDACHTHSAKAGQGMNVSMQDTFNLGWKLGSVLTGLSPASLLDTYSLERQVVAQKLIDFDREWSALMASRPLDTAHPELGGVDPQEVQAHYERSEVQASGFGVHYQPSMLTSAGEHQRLATGWPIGQRLKSARVMRVCDANPVHLGHHARADGRWRLYAFAGPEAPGHGGAIEDWARWLGTDPASPYVRTRTEGADAGAVFDVKVVYQVSHDDVDPRDVPGVFRPRFGPFQVIDEELVHAADDGTAASGGGAGNDGQDIYDARGIDRAGCVVVVRPDMYVATILPLNRPELLAEFFAPILQGAPARVDRVAEVEQPTEFSAPTR